MISVCVWLLFNHLTTHYCFNDLRPHWSMSGFFCSMKSHFTKTYTLPPKNEISGMHNGNSRIWHFDLLEMAWHQPQTSIVSVMQISRVLLWMKNHLAMSNKSKISNLGASIVISKYFIFIVVCDILWFGPWKLIVAFECKHINLQPHISS